ncbi:MAG: chemotaxis protein CheC [Firmicutes bacterium]|nr:chemotaxis protein CheC [Bacillota bacterium]
MSLRHLTSLQKDAIKEVSNIGAAHAATVLHQLLGEKVSMTVPEVSVVALSDICDVLGQPEDPMIGVYLRVFGDAPSKNLYLFPREEALFLAGLLLAEEDRQDNEDTLGELEVSALKEIGNILTGAYVYAFSSFTGLNMLSSVPALTFDMVGAILNTVLVDLGATDDYALLIETKLTACEVNITGHFFLVPDPGTLPIILDALGVKGQWPNTSGSECPK